MRLADPPLVLVLPGSRTGEIHRMAPVFGTALARVVEQFGPIEIVVPAVASLASTVRDAVSAWRVPARVITDHNDKHEAFRTARAALTKSGTSTLELALAGVPMVAAYRVLLVEAIAARFILKIPSVILANLVLGENVVPEFLQWHCTPKRLAAALLPLLTSTSERRIPKPGVWTASWRLARPVQATEARLWFSISSARSRACRANRRL